jgi:flagellar hook protein FlgE
MQISTHSVQAMLGAQTRIDQSAQRLQTPISQENVQANQAPDYATERVNQMRDERDFQAQTATIRTQDRMLGEILDLRA